MQGIEMEEAKNEIKCFENHGQDARYRDLKGCSCTLGVDVKFMPLVYSVDSYEGNSMKSANPNSGVHKSDVAKTLDTTTPTPCKGQGGQMVVERRVRLGIMAEKLTAQKRADSKGIWRDDRSLPPCFHLNTRDELISTEVPGALLATVNNKMQTYVCASRIVLVIDMMAGKTSCRLSDGKVSPTLATSHGESHAIVYGTSFDANYGCPMERELAQTLKVGGGSGYANGVVEEHDNDEKECDAGENGGVYAESEK